MNLADRIPSRGTDTLPLPDDVYTSFLEWSEAQGLELYPAQDEAVMELVSDANVILATPTGSGKSLVAVAAHFHALSSGQRSYYTAPIKALVSEKFFALCSVFGAESVGMVTGDSAVNQDAPIICCTAEILANIALREGAEAPLGMVIMDEFHFYSDPQRGWAWQVPLLELPQAQFLLMSATLGDVTRFEKALTELTGKPAATVSSAERPIPLHYYYVETTVHESLEELLATRQTPVYVVHFSQVEAIERAQHLMSINMCTRDEKDQIAALIGDFRFAAGFGKTLSRLVRHGIGVHHAGMLPKYRRLVEQLAQAGLLKVICGTDTLGVGINVPIRTVLLTALSKYDGVKTRLLSAREFHQISGRAGRAGYDTAGTVIVQAPEHVVENAKAMAKAQAKFGDDSKKLRQVVKKKPASGFVSWGKPTFERLIESPPEPLTSSFTVTHSMLLNLLERPGNPFTAARRLLTNNHEHRPAQLRLILKALGIFRELLNAGVVERMSEPEPSGRNIRLTMHLQENFALNQPLSPFALASLELLDPESASYALDVVSVIEATLEQPRQILRAQESKARGEAIASMKAEGMEYEERMNALDEVTYPQPLAELLQQAFDVYRQGAPWVGDFELSPKSIIRDMYERAMNFGEFVAFYQLARSEGIVLRYLADGYKALRQTVPVEALREDLEDLIAWLGELVRQVDSSLLDEWEQLTSGVLETPVDGSRPNDRLPAEPPALTSNVRAFRVMIRNELFRRVELAARDDVEALGAMDQDSGWTTDRWADALDDYWDEYQDIGTGPEARGPALLIITESSDKWMVRQIFDDPAGDHDWGISAEVDLAASNEIGAAAVRVTHVGPLQTT
ncbi:MAG TPA: DUF3516 domain-containing protein [Arthrobacter sp.]|nr:DUF3516 domain-containing protein [Arthrobacter sp.]